MKLNPELLGLHLAINGSALCAASLFARFVSEPDNMLRFWFLAGLVLVFVGLAIKKASEP